MRVQIQYKGLETSPWMEQFITRKCGKLERYLAPTGRVVVVLVKHTEFCSACIGVTNPGRSFTSTSQGADLHEAFLLALEHVARELSEHRRLIKERINRKYFSAPRGFVA